jgi:hypothetical protein
MIREKRLSRPASQVSPSSFSSRKLEASPKTTPLPPASSAESGTPIRETPRFCTHYEYPFFDARPEGFSELGPPTADVVSSHGAAPAQEYRLRLKQIPPNASRRCPPLKSSTPCSGLLLLRLFAPCSNVNCVSVLETKIAPKPHFSLQNGIQKIPGEKGENKGNGPTETVTAIQLNNKR